MSGFGTFICPKTGKEGCQCENSSYAPMIGTGDSDLHTYLAMLKTSDKIVFGPNSDPDNPSVDTPGFLVLKYARPT